MRNWIIVSILVVSRLVYAQPDQSLDIKPHYQKEAIAVVQLLNMYHFSHIAFNDSLSTQILQSYLDALDGSRLYFLESDIALFSQKYGRELDDLTEQGDVTPAFVIYKVFQRRFLERMDYINSALIDYKYDFTIDEYYDVDRDTAPYAKSEAELNDLWRKVIKNQYLGLKLAGKDPEGIKKTLTERYERLSNSFSKYRNDDVFQFYMNSVAEAYDPHTNYFSPAQSERFKQDISLSLEGIGARLSPDNDYIKIVEVLPGGPAFKSKLLEAGDRIVGVGQGKDGDIQNVIGWRVDDAVKIIKGPKETFVRLEILPLESGVNGPTKMITLQREKIKLEDQASEKAVYDIIKDGHPYKMGVITIPSFYMDFEAYQKGDNDYNSTTKDVKRLIGELKEEGVDGLLIDLRNNGGGSLKEAIELTGLFINEGPVVQVKNSLNKIEVDSDLDLGVTWSGPLSILINRFSASASEIFAGAIQDYNRGIIVGEQTFGKGTVQNIIPLERFIPKETNELGQIKLTLQKFYRVTGSSTQHKGVSPDVSLPSAFNAKDFGESSRPSALPWDRISSTSYKSTDDINPSLIAKINTDYSKRFQTDPFLMELKDEVDEIVESINETKISLNEAKRIQQQEERDKRKADRRKLSGEIVIEHPENNKIDIEDKYLREGIIILSEVIKSTIG